ncbi:MAG: hypothetical protein AAFP02_26055 [Bacteroidota bacterium]
MTQEQEFYLMYQPLSNELLMKEAARLKSFTFGDIFSGKANVGYKTAEEQAEERAIDRLLAERGIDWNAHVQAQKDKREAVRKKEVAKRNNDLAYEAKTDAAKYLAIGGVVTLIGIGLSASMRNMLFYGAILTGIGLMIRGLLSLKDWREYKKQ